MPFPGLEPSREFFGGPFDPVSTVAMLQMCAHSIEIAEGCAAYLTRQCSILFGRGISLVWNREDEPCSSMELAVQVEDWSLRSSRALGRHERLARRAAKTNTFFRCFQLKRHRSTTPDWQFSQPRSHGSMLALPQTSWRWALTTRARPDSLTRMHCCQAVALQLL